MSPRATTLFGLADQLGMRINYVPAEPVHSLIDAALVTIRATLGPDAFAETFAAGQQFSSTRHLRLFSTRELSWQDSR